MSARPAAPQAAPTEVAPARAGAAKRVLPAGRAMYSVQIIGRL